MQKINYTDKVKNNGVSPSGMWTAENATEVKRVVNANAQEVIEQYAKKAELIKVNAEYIAVSSTALPQPNQTNGWTILGGGTYTQNNGAPITVADGELAIASFNGSTWTKGGTIELPSNTAELVEWVAGTYNADDTRTYQGKIYRANKTTNLIPSTTSNDWDVLGGSEVKLDVAGGAVSFEAIKNNALSMKISTPNIGQYINGLGGVGGFWFYRCSNFIDLNAGDTVTVRTVTENIGNPAIAVYSVNDVFIPTESKFFINNDLATFAYTATEQRRIRINLGYPEAQENEIANVQQPIFVGGGDIDNEDSPMGVPSLAEFTKLKENKAPKVYGRDVFTLIGGFTASGVINNDEGQVTYTRFFKLKAGETVLLKGLNVTTLGIVLDLDFNFIESINQNVRDLGTEDKYTQTYTATTYCYLIAQTHTRNYLGQIEDYGSVTIDTPNFLQSSNLGEDSDYGVARQSDVKYLLENGGSTTYRTEIFNKRGISYDGITFNPSAVHHRLSNLIQLNKGQFLTAYLANEHGLDHVGESQPSVFILSPDGTILKERLFGAVTGFNQFSYLATENVTVSFCHFQPQPYVNKQWVTVTRPKIYATPDDIGTGGGGGGTGKYIPDVTRYNPVNLIEIDLTTTDPIPEAKGTFMGGAGSFKIDGVVHNMFFQLEVQGSSSAAFPEKNWTIAMFKDAGFTDSKKMRIANFVPHDEFVLKVNWIDPTQTANISANRLWEQMIQTRTNFPKRESDFALLNKTGALAMDTGALAHVDGFPAVFKINNEYYGIGTLNIGKKYQNYNLLADDQSNVQIELGNGVDYNSFSASSIEVRRPKTVNATTNQTIGKLATICSTPVEGGAFSIAARNGFWTTNIVDMYLFLDYLQLVDCLSRNNHIMTFDNGQRWLFTPYDLDTWHVSFNGAEVSNPIGRVWDSGLNVPENTRNFWAVKVWGEYQTEIVARYKELRTCGVFSADNVYNLCQDISVKFGRDLYADDLTKWTVKDMRGGLQRVQTYMQQRTQYLDAIYGYTS